jgi:hypothetical protein
MANSSFETFKQGGEAVDEAARKTGQQAGNLYEQAKDKASAAYDSAAEYTGDAVSRMQDGVTDLDDMVSEQVGRRAVRKLAHPGTELARLREVVADEHSNTRGAAVGARVVNAFQRAVRMQHHGARMAHGVRISISQDLDVVTGR